MDRWYAGYVTGVLVVLAMLVVTDPLYAREAARLCRYAAARLDVRAQNLERELIPANAEEAA